MDCLITIYLKSCLQHILYFKSEKQPYRWTVKAADCHPLSKSEKVKSRKLQREAAWDSWWDKLFPLCLLPFYSFLNFIPITQYFFFMHLNLSIQKGSSYLFVLSWVILTCKGKVTSPTSHDWSWIHNVVFLNIKPPCFPNLTKYFSCLNLTKLTIWP